MFKFVHLSLEYNGWMKYTDKPLKVSGRLLVVVHPRSRAAPRLLSYSPRWYFWRFIRLFHPSVVLIGWQGKSNNLNIKCKLLLELEPIVGGYEERYKDVNLW